MEPWQTRELSLAGRRRAVDYGDARAPRPPDGDRGPVIGFVLDRSVYVSGDTVWFDGRCARWPNDSISRSLFCSWALRACARPGRRR